MSGRFTEVKKRFRGMFQALREVNSLIYEADKILMCVVLAESIQFLTVTGTSVTIPRIGSSPHINMVCRWGCIP